MIIDSHIHLNATDYASSLPDLISEGLSQNIKAWICIGAGYGSDSIDSAVSLAEQYESIYAAVGIHPCDAHNQIALAEVERHLSHPKVVAIGETGLDYYHDQTTKNIQTEYFIAQINLAKKYKKPIIVHSRMAATDCLNILTEQNAAEVGGVFHCYSEDAEFAKKLRSINFMVSFPGVLTFKKSEQTRLAASQIPLDQIMLETDGPFLAPDPYRGKLCRPAYINFTAKKLAEIRNLPQAELEKIVYANTIKFFNLPI